MFVLFIFIVVTKPFFDDDDADDDDDDARISHSDTYEPLDVAIILLLYLDHSNWKGLLQVLVKATDDDDDDDDDADDVVVDDDIRVSHNETSPVLLQ